MPFANLSHDFVSLEQWRAKLLSWFMQVIFLSSFLVGIPNLLIVTWSGQLHLIAIHTLALVWVTYLFLNRKANVVTVSMHILAGLYMLGVAALVAQTWLALTYLIVLPIAAALLLSERAAFFCLMLNAVTLFFCGYMLNFDAGAYGLPHAPVFSWLLITATFTVISAALAVSCAFLLRGMNKVLHDQQENVKKLHELAMFDPLTGLPNRRLLDDRFQRAVQQAKRQGCQFAVVVMDIDKFKQVNDSCGHQTGDALIKSIGQRIVAVLRSTDTVARLGGDEFAILLTDLRTNGLLEALQRIHSAVCGLHILPLGPIDVTSSMGVAVFPHDGEDQHQLFKNADVALYQAKAQGKNRFCIFDPQLSCDHGPSIA
jgi:diguanylate cyclase (GGDEF)-like protein